MKVKTNWNLKATTWLISSKVVFLAWIHCPMVPKDKLTLFLIYES